MLLTVAQARNMLEGYDADEWVEINPLGGQKVPFVSSSSALLAYLKANPDALVRIEDDGSRAPLRIFVEIAGTNMMRIQQKTWGRTKGIWVRVKEEGEHVPGTMHTRNKVSWLRLDTT